MFVNRDLPGYPAVYEEVYESNKLSLPLPQKGFSYNDKVSELSVNETEVKRDSDWEEAMRARREARMVSACSPCANTRSAIIYFTYSWAAGPYYISTKSTGHEIELDVKQGLVSIFYLLLSVFMFMLRGLFCFPSLKSSPWSVLLKSIKKIWSNLQFACTRTQGRPTMDIICFSMVNFVTIPVTEAILHLLSTEINRLYAVMIEIWSTAKGKMHVIQAHKEPAGYLLSCSGFSQQDFGSVLYLYLRPRQTVDLIMFVFIVELKWIHLWHFKGRQCRMFHVYSGLWMNSSHLLFSVVVLFFLWTVLGWKTI